MSTRAVDLQSILFRLQDVQQIQTTGQEQPQTNQAQFAQMFVSHVDQQREQVTNPNQTEGTIIRDEGGGQKGNQRQRRRRKEEEKMEEAPRPFQAQSGGGRIDVWV